MKFRKDFVTNSSSSSYTCDICGATESGWDISLEEAGMVECVNGHTICNDELLEIPRKELIKKILESGYENESEEELNSQHDNDSLPAAVQATSLHIKHSQILMINFFRNSRF